MVRTRIPLAPQGCQKRTSGCCRRHLVDAYHALRARRPKGTIARFSAMLMREERTVRRWMHGDSPVPLRVGAVVCKLKGPMMDWAPLIAMYDLMESLGVML